MNMPLKTTEINSRKTSQLILSATRSWVWAIMAESCRTARGRYVHMWNECFEQIGDKSLAMMWGSFLRHLTLEGNAKFLLGCSGCGRASKDEAILLDCLALHQSGNKDEAYKMLSRWFEGEAQWKADALIEAFADQLSLKGFLINEPNHGSPADLAKQSAGATQKWLN